jgi:hypothetical protein
MGTRDGPSTGTRRWVLHHPVWTSACRGPGDAAGARVVRDSLGIRLVDLPRVDAAGVPRVLALDPTWTPAAGREVGELLAAATP